VAILKNIEWTIEDQDTIIQKYDLGKNQVNKGSALTVREGQAAIFIYKGKLADVYLPGFYKLDTDNMPILTKLMSWKYGFQTPFKADIYFVSTKQFTNQKWGTANPIIVRDQDYGAVRVRAYGTYAFRVQDPYIFMKNVTGTCSNFTSDEISGYLRSLLVSGITDSLGESKLSILDLAGNMQEMGDMVEKKLAEDFKNIGLEISKFTFENFSLPEALEKALDENSALSMYRKNMDVYAAKGQTDALMNASKNTGAMGGFMGAGLGMTMGNMMGQQMTQANNQSACPKCKCMVKEGTKFCPECGTKLKPTCPDCKKEYPAGTKFCPECGKKL
jgi:membrane protease subunit (stomatin/prohibitin family)